MKKISASSKLDGNINPLPEGSTIATHLNMMGEMQTETVEQPTKHLPLDSSLIDECFLAPDDFRSQLQREKRRVERSSLPLSIALFEFPESTIENRYQLRNFLDSLRTRTRETDIKGWVNANTVGVILLDTNGAGLNNCVKTITQVNNKCPFSVVLGTYPDSLFEQVLDESKTEPELSPFDLDYASSDQTLAHFFKRCFDIFGALAGLIVFSPVIVLTALAIKISSPGSIIFKQVRIGRKGVRFDFYKFRSMYMNNDDRVHREFLAGLIEGNHEALNQGDEKEPVFKIVNDQRITPVGRIIRRLSLDELPQFFNVLKGDMSLVGPRPPIPYEVEKYKPWHLRRILEIKPGITGLWQVEGRSRTSFDEMVRLDLRYLMNWSFWLDIKILLKTIKAVVQTKGAV